MQGFLKNYENLQTEKRIKSVGLKEIPCTKKELVVDLEQLKFTYITVVK